MASYANAAPMLAATGGTNGVGALLAALVLFGAGLTLVLRRRTA